MQRLFSTFANGWPGTGLLIQRLLIGIAFLHYGVAQLEQTHRVAIFAPSLIEASWHTSHPGLGTPVTGALAALTEVWSIFWHRGDLWIAIILATFATSLSMIGPGTWSIDTYLLSGSA